MNTPADAVLCILGRDSDRLETVPHILAGMRQLADVVAVRLLTANSITELSLL